MSLIKAFARQIDGELTISGPPGTLISLSFKTKGQSQISMQIAR
jgi:two-component sensor histidine kinase